MTFGNVEQNFDEEGIREDERNKVLEDVAQWVEKHTHRCQSLRIAVITKYALLDFLKELRQQQVRP